MADHRIKPYTRRRHDDEPEWLSPIDGADIHVDVLRQIERNATFVVVCDVDDIPVYRDLSDQWVHWSPEDDPSKPSGQQELTTG